MNDVLVSCIESLPLALCISLLGEIFYLYLVRKKHVDNKMIEMAKVFRMPKVNEIKYIYIPALKSPFLQDLKWTIISTIVLAVIMGVVK